MSEIINMNNVSWRREGKDILSTINWQVKDGEHWAIIGLNGAGKTSLLNMVNGYTWPTTGEVSVLGKKFGETNIYQMRTEIGWVSSSLEQRMNGRYLAEDIVVSGVKKTFGFLYEEPEEILYEEAKKLMEKLNCLHTYGKRYEMCSHGEKQKILIARGLMANPKLLILDEPTTGLDFIAREDLLNTLTQMSQSENMPTLIYVTHHTEEIIPLFTHTLLLQEGRVYAAGLNKDVLTNENLSGLFNREVTLDWHAERPWMRLV
ncbi:MAG TPA: ABC transporter ATP-binding protein [Pseudogracilibacillus sp.]|nr:ABC transporter ATP-binding protein [Pseudogracilibacillus sp.]